MDLQNTWLKYGIIYGVISIIIFLISSYVFPLGMWTQFLIGMIIAITIFILAGKEERMKQGGYLSYGKALKTTFLAGFTGMVISGLFTLILINLIDPGLADVLKEQILESTKSMMEAFGAPEDAISEAMEKAEEGMEDQFTPLSQLLNILKGGIFVLVIAAIVSIFLKKEEKVV